MNWLWAFVLIPAGILLWFVVIVATIEVCRELGYQFNKWRYRND